MEPAPSLEHCLALHNNKQWQAALAAYKSLLTEQPQNLVALANLGAVYRQLNDVNNARKYYQQAVDIEPNFSDGWFNFGNLCLAIKDIEQARICYQTVLALQPENQPAMYQLATVFRELQHWTLCHDQLVALLALSPSNTNALLELGNTWKHLGDAVASRDCYLLLVKHAPRSWKGHFSLAKYYDAEADKALLQQHLAMALQYAPSAWLVHYSLAQARFDNGNYAGALAQYEQALHCNKDDPKTLIALGACAMRLGDTDKATAIFGQVSKSVDVALLSQLAQVIWEYKFFDETIVILKKIVSLRPDLADAYLNLAKAQYESWLMSAAKASLEKALSLRPGYVEAVDLLTSLMLRQGKVDKCLPIFHETITRDGELSSAVSSFLFTELYSANVSAEEKFTHHQTFMDTWVKELGEQYEFTNNNDATKKITIGLVSADFRDQHPVGIFVQPLLNYLDRERFNIVGYYGSRTYDTSTELIRAKMDSWFDVAGWADGRLRSKIIADEVDILIDLSGHTAKHRLKLFAMRAAPIQVTWMGYPHSTGLSTMDYMIADEITCPVENDRLCSETVVRLNQHSVFCFPPTDEFGEVDTDKAAARKVVVFGSFNNLTKVNEDTLALWRDVMLAVPEAILKLKTPSFADAQCRKDYLDYFMQAGIAADRLVFSGPSSLYDMMREYAEVDIALDTLPYNGGTTSFQALWMGVPVLTMLGANFCGRMGASAMTRLNMHDWIADSRQDFINKAVDFAADREKLLAVKTGLRQRMMASPLCDEKGFGVAVGKILAGMWVDYCETAVNKTVG